MLNRKRTTSWRAPRMLSAQQQVDLQQALASPATDGAKRWMAQQLGRPMQVERGWDCLQRLKQRCQAPADPQRQATFNNRWGISHIPSSA
jgi:hypothetical protein